MTPRPPKVTYSHVPSGRSRLAAVYRLGSKICPLAVGRPAKPGPYQDAMPWKLTPVDAKPEGMAGAGPDGPSSEATLVEGDAERAA
jgi:hypothetical protein